MAFGQVTLKKVDGSHFDTRYLRDICRFVQENYVSSMFKLDRVVNSWTFKFFDGDRESIWPKPEKYAIIQRERARITAYVALELCGYEDDDIAEALHVDKLRCFGKASDMLHQGLKELIQKGKLVKKDPLK